jgi:hypothetical protein
MENNTHSRFTRKKPRFVPDLPYLPTILVRPSPFPIRSDREPQRDYWKQDQVVEYGDDKIIVSGRKANMKTRILFTILAQEVIIRQFTGEDEPLRFNVSCRQLAIQLYGSYTEESRKSIWKNFKCLREVSFEFITWDGKRTLFGPIDIVKDIDENQDWVEVLFNEESLKSLCEKREIVFIDVKFACKLKKDISVGIYYFGQSWVTGGTEVKCGPIELEKFSRAIGLDWEGRSSLAKKTYQIKEALEELKKEGYVVKYGFEKIIKHKKLTKNITQVWFIIKPRKIESWMSRKSESTEVKETPMLGRKEDHPKAEQKTDKTVDEGPLSKQDIRSRMEESLREGKDWWDV